MAAHWAHGVAARAVGASFRADLAGRLEAEAGLTTSLLFHDPGIDVHSLVRGLDLDFVHPAPTSSATAPWPR